MNENSQESIKKKVDESWKETVEKEKGEDRPGQDKEVLPEVTFRLFITGLMMEALVALGELENPATKKLDINIAHAKFIIDTLSMLEEKTKNNLVTDEADALQSLLYDLRMRFVTKVNKTHDK